MTDAEFVTNGHLVITGFLMLIIDRTAALHVASRKANRVLTKKVTPAEPQTLQIRVLQWLQNGYWLAQAIIFLAAFWVLGLLQIINPKLIQDEVGKITFASVVFLVSFGCSVLNAMIEDLDRRL
jgi:hypothetical protein